MPICPLIGLFDERVTHFGCHLDSALLTCPTLLCLPRIRVFSHGVSQAVFLTKINIISMVSHNI